MSTEPSTKVQMLGALHTLRRERGLDSTATVSIPPEGRCARDVALDLDLPVEKIVAVFVNHRAYGLDRVINEGDRVAFVPRGIPSPVFLGVPGKATMN